MSALAVVERPLAPVRRRVTSLAVLGDSTAVGLGDPTPGGEWRGVARFIADAADVNGSQFSNLAFMGARIADVRHRQLPTALAMSPDVALVIAGMNDTLRADFDPSQMSSDLAAVAQELHAAHCAMLTFRYHDHTRLFRLPGPLRRTLQQRIDELNTVIDDVAVMPGVVCVDVARLPVDDRSLWSVDRLHPSELGHRHLARACVDALTDRGFGVARRVGLACGGGVPSTRASRAWWMVSEGIPWMCRRSKDLVPYAAVIVARSVWERRDRRRLPPHYLDGAATANIELVEQ